MTAFVAVCLTLTTPYVFKIARSFLSWFIGLLSWLTTEWNNSRTAKSPSSSSSVAESRTPLLGSQHTHYETSERQEDNIRSNSRDGQHSNGSSSAVAQLKKGQSDNQHDIAQSAPQEQSTPTNAIDPNPARRTPPVRRDEDLVNALNESQDSREVVWKFVKSLPHRGAKQVDSPSTITIVVVTVLFGLFVAQAVAGVFSAKIASDRAGLSSSQHCGIWQFNENAGGDAADRDDLNNYQKEARASQYARTCYNSPDPAGPFSCKVFYNQSIAYTTKIKQPCPFASSHLCHDGLYSAISFDTGLIDASVIGINSPTNHKFRRTTSCSPLNMSEPYVVQSSSGPNGSAYHYYYGTKDSTNYTFNTSGQPFEWLVPVYSVR